MSEKLKKLLEIFKELWYLPFVVYYVGFIYVQGYFAPYTGDLFIAKDFLTVYPVSQSLYLINGIFLVIFIAIPIVFLIALPSKKRTKKKTPTLNILSKSIRNVKYFIERHRHCWLVKLLHITLPVILNFVFFDVQMKVIKSFTNSNSFIVFFCLIRSLFFPLYFPI